MNELAFILGRLRNQYDYRVFSIVTAVVLGTVVGAVVGSQAAAADVGPAETAVTLLSVFVLNLGLLGIGLGGSITVELDDLRSEPARVGEGDLDRPVTSSRADAEATERIAQAYDEMTLRLSETVSEVDSSISETALAADDGATLAEEITDLTDRTAELSEMLAEFETRADGPTRSIDVARYAARLVASEDAAG